MPIATLTSKGQITIPKEIRELLRLEAGNRVDFVVDRKGKVMLHPINGDFRSLRGIIKTNKRVSIEEMNEAIAAGWAGE